MNDNTIDNLLQNWYEAKQQISSLEAKLDSFKKIAENIMDHKNCDSLNNEKYVLQRKDINRTSISKKDLPLEIWNKYCKENFYSSFYISKVNHKKKSIKRSRKRILNKNDSKEL